MMFQAIQWNDDEGNQVIAVSEAPEKLKQHVSDWHEEQYGEPLEWRKPLTTGTDVEFETPHKYGMQYSIEEIEVV
jgi:hypothetical protein